MPQQAILDLPVIEFEPHVGSPQRLHAHCIEAYGINGLLPHPDAAFHFGASLWRYREGESPRQVAGLAWGYLNALTTQVAARRRLAAARAGTRNVDRIEDAELELEDAEAALEEVTAHVLQFVGDMLEQAATEPARARRRLDENVRAMAEDGWADELEQWAQRFTHGKPRVDWSQGLVDVLDELERVNVPPANGHKLDDQLIQRLERELSEYREIATTASSRLQQVDVERRELETLLAGTEADFANRATELDAARLELEQTLSQARKRLESLDASASPAELEKLRAERDRLADELLRVMDAGTDTEASREELMEHLERAATDREQAADAIGSLSKRLDAVQRDAEATAERAEAYRNRMAQLEDQLNELRVELADAEQRNQQAQAVIHALEQAQGRNTEFESILTDSEARLADTEERLEDAQLRADALGGELEDTRYELEKAREKLAQQKGNLDSVSGQLAEAETLAGEQETRIAELERENERLRRDLSDAQTRMFDAKGDLDEARATHQNLEVEVKRLNERISEERGKAERAQRERQEAAKALESARTELQGLQQARDVLAQQLETLKGTAAAAEKDIRQRDRDLKHAREQLDKQQAQLAGQLAGLEQARETAAQAEQKAAASEKQARESTTARQKAEAEAGALRASLERTKAELADALAERVLHQNELAETREQGKAAADLAAERHARLAEKLELLAARVRRQDTELAALADTLADSESSRQQEKAELEAVAQRATSETAAARRQLDEARADMRRLQDKLNETETFLIARQRDLDKAENRFKSLLDEVGAVADLRAQYEKADADKQREKLATQISGRMDSLFAAAGRPVHADRRTEKIVILHVKKSDTEIAAEAEKPFIATKGGDDSNIHGAGQ
ncbi:MAG: hypothetical protein KF696_10145 [Planctomycetes bacterium]|nr:hypothetical protein [Planctomycetota bacterium]MCW8135211.1 hypothetical protein [Planctomycetota bacterium]